MYLSLSTIRFKFLLSLHLKNEEGSGGWHKQEDNDDDKKVNHDEGK